MTLVGKSTSISSSGKRVTTLYVTEPFEDYYRNPEAGRTCVGERVESIYVGDYDCTDLDVGVEIEVLYGKTIHGKKGDFQPIARIEVV